MKPKSVSTTFWVSHNKEATSKNRVAERFRGRARQNALSHLHDSKPNFTCPSVALPARNLPLDIYVGKRCPICQSSLAALQTLRSDLPNLRLNVIDLDAPDTPRPDTVIAIPSFLINGHLVAAGTFQGDELKRFIPSLK